MNWKVTLWTGLLIINLGLALLSIRHMDMWGFGVAWVTMFISIINILVVWEE